MNNFQKIIKVFLWLRTFVAFWSTKNQNSSKRKDILKISFTSEIYDIMRKILTNLQLVQAFNVILL